MALSFQQLEQWYQANLWTSLMNKIYGYIPGLTCVLGESSSVVSKERKRLEGQRLVSRLGPRTDMVLRRTGNGISLDYGAVEDGASYQDTSGRKQMPGSELKIPKALEDMMIMLCDDCGGNPDLMRKTEVVGYYHSGFYQMSSLVKYYVERRTPS